MKRVFEDLINQKFGRLTVKTRGPNTRFKQAQFWCLCDCGNGVLVAGYCLKSTNTKSCGCLQREQVCARTGKNHPMCGKMSGRDNPNWRGGIATERDYAKNSQEYKFWRAEIFKRDNYICQKCEDATGGNLNAHHIESFAGNKELRTEVSNGITLCKVCHLNFHHQFGYGNNTRKQLVLFLGKYQK